MQHAVGRRAAPTVMQQQQPQLVASSSSRIVQQHRLGLREHTLAVQVQQQRTTTAAAAAVVVAASLVAPPALAALPSVQQQQQQQQQQHTRPLGFSSVSRAAPALAFDVAFLEGFGGGGGGSGEEVDPFTLYGSTFKSYSIEKLDGEKVVARSRGFTVDSCVSAVAESSESPEFNSLSTGEKVSAGAGLLCKRATGPDLKPACRESCGAACADALERYEARVFAESGLRLDAKQRERVLRGCRHGCSYECTKSGKAHDFVTPMRR